MRTGTRIALVSSVIMSLSATALAQQPNFTGTWSYNDGLSQDPFEKIYQALGSEQLRGAGTAPYNAVSSGTLLRDSDRAATLRALLKYAQVLQNMEIEHTDDEIKIWVGDGDDFFSLFYLDGEKHPRELDGLRIEASAAWEGESIHVVQVGENGAVLKQIISEAAKEDQLALVFVLESKLSEMPIQFRVVYDRVNEN